MTKKIEGHTVQRYDGELNHLHMQALEMGALVLNQVKAAIAILQDKDLGTARKMIDRDHEVNTMEVSIDEDIVTTLARRCPVARDLRLVMALSKTVTDLERIADEAAKIAGLALAIYDNDRSNPSEHLMRDVHTMGKLAASMLHEALEVFDKLDGDRAEHLAVGRSELDAEFQAGLRRLATFIMEDSRNVGHAINIVLITKALERIGDHSKNISEYVVYLIKGKDIRHRIPSTDAS